MLMWSLKLLPERFANTQLGEKRIQGYAERWTVPEGMNRSAKNTPYTETFLHDLKVHIEHFLGFHCRVFEDNAIATVMIPR